MVVLPQGLGHLFVHDFVQFLHPQLGLSCGKILKFYLEVKAPIISFISCVDVVFLLQEGSNAVHAEVEILLNFNQISVVFPRVSILYTDTDAVLRHSSIEILIVDVVSLLSPPKIVLTLDSFQILQQQTLRVCSATLITISLPACMIPTGV